MIVLALAAIGLPAFAGWEWNAFAHGEDVEGVIIASGARCLRIFDRHGPSHPRTAGYVEVEWLQDGARRTWGWCEGEPRPVGAPVALCRSPDGIGVWDGSCESHRGAAAVDAMMAVIISGSVLGMALTGG